VAIEGPLKELHIDDVFQLLDLGRKTGVLRVTSELRQNAGTVFFENGAVVGAMIVSNPHPLGELLIRTGKVSEEAVVRARTRQASRPDQRLGELLVEIGAISRRELDRNIRAQVEEVIFELMSWSEGYFRFEEGEPGQSPAEATFRIAPESLLMEAARRIDEWSRIVTKIPHQGVVPGFNPDQMNTAGSLELVPFEWEVLAAIDGTATVREVADRLRQPEFDVSKAIFGLASAGIVILRDAAAESGNGTGGGIEALTAQADDHLAAGDLAGAHLVAQDAVMAYPDEGNAYLLLTRAALANGRFSEALDAVHRALRLLGDTGPGLRMLGLALAGSGRFGEALTAWERWNGLDSKDPEEARWGATINQLGDAARLLNNAVRGRHD
jgi:tetratricopeptide (TPR) repeat protein